MGAARRLHKHPIAVRARAEAAPVYSRLFTPAGGLSDLTSRSVRDKFARLSQVATVLALESVGELLDYWGDAATVAWRLSEADVRQVLAQRVDFLPAEINALRL